MFWGSGMPVLYRIGTVKWSLDCIGCVDICVCGQLKHTCLLDDMCAFFGV